MNQQIHLGSGDPPTKRRRGRPRKDESLSHPQRLNLNMPSSPNLIIKTIQAQVETPSLQSRTDLGKGKSPLDKPIGVGEDEMIGQVVIGVLEGTFDAGYFLTMRVAESETYLKGLVFQTGKFVPITAENDIAPFATMYSSKTGLSIPVLEKKNEAESAEDKEVGKEHVEYLESTKQQDHISQVEHVSGSRVEEEEKLQHDTEQKGIAKEKLELLASLSVEMGLTKHFMDSQRETELAPLIAPFPRRECNDIGQQYLSLGTLAKKPKTGGAMHWTEAISAEELKAATTLNELESLQTIKGHGKSSGCETKQPN